MASIGKNTACSPWTKWACYFLVLFTALDLATPFQLAMENLFSHLCKETGPLSSDDRDEEDGEAVKVLAAENHSRRHNRKKMDQEDRCSAQVPVCLDPNNTRNSLTTRPSQASAIGHRLPNGLAAPLLC